MDKKNTIIGIILLGAAFAMLIWQGKTAQDAAQEYEQTRQAQETLADETGPQGPSQGLTTGSNGTAPAIPSANGEESDGIFSRAGQAAAEIAPTKQDAPEELYVLENDFVRVTFSSHGGSIKSVEFVHRMANGKLDYPATLDSDTPYMFNEGASLPALAISLDADRDGVPEEYAPAYHLEKQTDSTILFSLTTKEGGRIYRGYAIDKLNADGEYTFPDPYVILHETKFLNQTDAPLDLKRLWVNVGTAPATKGDTRNEFLNFGYYNGADSEFIKMTKFTGSSGFLGIGASLPHESVLEPVKPLVWASVKNQFFAAVLTPDIPGNGIFSKPEDLSATIKDPDLQQGLTGSVEFNLGQLAVGGEQLLGMQYYVGPKEYLRLAELGKNQDEVMQFGFLSGISKLLLLLLIWIHDLVVNISPTWAWGWAIIVVTIIIKGCLWPLTRVQVRSAKRMAKIQKPLAELREKYKDDQQMMMQKQMALFKENRINPAAGCLPLLVQMPIFIGLFYMLRTASELRFAPFLWINDLALPDTIAHVAGFPINILPLLMTAAMVVQMRMTPTPTTDNFQRKVFQFMPVIFLAFCYTFPSGLVLYWTCQNLISVLQQFITNRSKDEEPVKLKPGEKPKESFMERMQRKAQEAQKAQAEQQQKLKGRGPKNTAPTKKRSKKK
ncbi:membrane protein insertase YidC [Rubellicoccus peritrichatus]|uniref:Membrane protein insertase YidC n=1 Tax=Rubellicoccus peritrichatus TaxID=3080537 RepID=A0AAQ3L9A9_9BACT|nr:membrane protein insertase YidC [Puniceicoccus sp. CR14]WOO41999.1 membrane protein insertase YidC [Puniceicoccus sp. CR14]